MNINGYDVVYDGQVYHVVDLNIDWDFDFLCDKLEDYTTKRSASGS